MSEPLIPGLPPNVPVLDYAKAPRKPSPLRIVIYLLLIAVVFYFVGKNLLRCFREINWHEVSLNPLFLSLSLLALIFHRMFTGLITNMLLASFDSAIGYVRCSAVIWSAAMGRYVPGKMAAVVGAVLLLARAGVRIPIALATLFLSTALTIVIAMVIAAPMLLLSTIRRQLPHAWIPASLIILFGLTCLHPRIFTRLCNLILKLIKRPPLPGAMRIGPFMAACAFIAARCAMLGVAMWLTTRAFMPIGVSLYPIILGAAVLAAVGGFLAVFVPAGLGVQEAIYLIALGSPELLGPKVALMAVIFRLLQVATDAITGASGVAMLRTMARPQPQ